MNQNFRDQQLGEVLERLVDTPEHRPSFFNQLERDLANVAAEKRTERVQRRFGIKMITAAAVPAMAAALVLVVAINTGNPAPTMTPPQIARPQPSTPPVTELEPTLASHVVARMERTLSTATSLQGQMIQTNYPYPDNPGPPVTKSIEFVVAANGNYKEVSTDGLQSTYIASSAELFIDHGYAAQEQWTAETSTGVDPAIIRIAAAIRASVVNGNPGIRSVVHEGKDSWQWEYVPLGSADRGVFFPDFVSVIADKESGLPLQLSSERKGRPLVLLQFVDLDLNGGLAPDVFQPPANYASQNDADAYNPRLVTVSEVRSQVEYTPLAPADLPDGFELTQVLYTPVSPWLDQAIDLTYRRGLDVVRVQTSRLRPLELRKDPWWTDAPAEVRALRVHDGAFAGFNAQIVTTTDFAPYIYVEGRYTGANIGGSLTTQELEAAINSMTELRPPSSLEGSDS